MNMVIKLLVYSLKTINGNKNTAVPVLRALINQDVREYKRDNNLRKVADDIKKEMRRKNEYRIYK